MAPTAPWTFVTTLTVARNLNADLKTDNPGIVESALFVIVEYRNRYPALDYSSLIDELAKVARDEKDSTISYKAHLAMMYLRYHTDGGLVPSSDPDDHESLFRQITEQLEKKFLALKLPEWPMPAGVSRGG